MTQLSLFLAFPPGEDVHAPWGILGKDDFCDCGYMRLNSSQASKREDHTRLTF